MGDPSPRVHLDGSSGTLTVHRAEYFYVQHYRASVYVRVIRTEVAFPSVSDAIQAIGACRLALSGIDTFKYGILFDWRRSPLSTDPNLHKALAEYVDALAVPFARKAILLGTTVGAMQAARVGRTAGNQKLAIFDDEDQALKHVTGR